MNSVEIKRYGTELITGSPYLFFLRRLLSIQVMAIGAISGFILTGCGGSQGVAQDTIQAQQAIQQRTATEEFNRKLSAFAIARNVDNQLIEQEYRIGSGDVLDITVFQVEELNTTVRVNGRGTIILPLLGELDVGGQTLVEVERSLEQRLTEFMHNPQVSLFISEYQSQQVSVTGAVNRPALHTLTRPRTVLELVAMSGGLSEEAGKQIYVQTLIDNESQRLIIDLNDVLSNPSDQSLAIILQGGDSVFVPESGTVFVEGAVERPGAYQLEGETGVIEALAMAGGVKFEAQKNVQIVTLGLSGKREVISVNLDDLRSQQAPSVALRDGDIVLVSSNTAKAGFAGFWRGLTGVFNIGYGIGGP